MLRGEPTQLLFDYAIGVSKKFRHQTQQLTKPVKSITNVGWFI